MRTPTVRTMGWFAAYDSAGSLIKAMRSQKSVPLIQPRIAKDGRRLLPGDAGYEQQIKERLKSWEEKKKLQKR